MTTMNTKQKLKSLDVLKGIAMIMIIVVHNRHFIMKDMNGMRQLINYGQTGVQLFFLISGMSLCYAWYHLTESNQEKNWVSCVKTFIRRRYLRLAPGFFIVLFINYILNVILIDFLHMSPGYIMNREPVGILVNVLFLHGFFPDYINSVFPSGWYIGTTFILYALFPLLVLSFEKLHTLNRHSIFLLPIAFLSLDLFISKGAVTMFGNKFYPYNDSFMFFFFPNQLPAFALGILLYFQEKEYFSRHFPLWLSTTLTVITSYIAVHFYLHPNMPYAFCIIPFLCGISFYWLAVTLLHIEYKINRETIAIKKSAKLSKIVSYFVNFLADCGKNSYGMYLVHGFFSWYIMKALTTTLMKHGINYNELQLYFLLLVPTILAVYGTGRWFDVLLNYLDKKLRK